MSTQSRGVLYPARLPEFARLPAPASISQLVRWFWCVEWDISPGRISRQEVIAFPASNLTVDPRSVDLWGPTTKRGDRDLSGRGWTIGALLKPAAIPRFTDEPAALRDGSCAMQLPELHSRIGQAMTTSRRTTDRFRDAADAFAQWILANVPAPTVDGVRANTMAELIDADSTIVRLDDLSSRLGVSPRTTQRLANRYVGLSPAAMIRRRRIQAASELLRTDASLDVAEVAATLGYADQAHLAHDFRIVLGIAPSEYRSAATITPLPPAVATPRSRPL